MNPTTKGITVGADIKTLKPAIRGTGNHFDDTCFAPICIVLAVHALLDGSADLLRFVRARRDGQTGIWQVVDQVFVGLDDGSTDDEHSTSAGSVRWASEDGDPMGDMSHSVVSSWSRYYQDEACVAATIAAAFASPADNLGVFWIALDPKPVATTPATATPTQL